MVNDPIDVLKETDGQCFEKAKKAGELTFTVVEHDMTSSLVIVDWIKYNLRNCRPEKLHNALERAIIMARSDLRRHAD